jgi:hypothetical protein
MQEYTGEPVDLPGPPGIIPSGQNPAPKRPMPKKTAFSQTDLQPLVLPGGQSVNIIHSGKTKIFEIISR